ncbi:uncharacterized protein LOC141627502 [Silene latifolia]|uniref:uncharacterized protein LOC141627502 n=1 Tax=Silene latifolia TaxID=37657 RepID=UPI003D776DD5
MSENTLVVPVVHVPSPQCIDVDEVHLWESSFFDGDAWRSVKEYVDGYENIGASLTEFKNFGREIKCFIGLKDAQMFVDQLEHLHETHEGFYFAYDIDQNKCLFRVFWADAAARRNYALYGEAVTFDPTYSTNKYDMIFAPFTGVDHHKKSVTFGASLISRENDQNFKWIFTKILDCMGGKEPHCFFTDQCPAMKIAVPRRFYDRFPSLLHVAYYEEITRKVLVILQGGQTRFLEVEDSIFNKSYTIAFNPSTFDATCSRKSFERKGYICKHIIWILSGKGIKKIPDKYLLSRWTKNTKKMPLYDAHGQLLDDFTSSDVTKLRFRLPVRILLNINTAKSLAENHINEPTSLYKTFRQNFKSDL